MTFDAWLAKVDEAMWTLAGCSIWDLPDFDYWQAWLDRTGPNSCANEVYEESLTY